MNAWPVDMLQQGDVYVSDHFGLKQDGPSIGDNVGNAIYARSGNGIVYDGAVRDINGLKELPNRSEEHTSELQSLMRISYAVFCLKKKTRLTETIVNPISSTQTE